MDRDLPNSARNLFMIESIGFLKRRCTKEESVRESGRGERWRPRCDESIEQNRVG